MFFELFRPTTLRTKNTLPVSGCEKLYYKAPNDLDSYSTDCLPHFYILLMPDGQPWREANTFLLSEYTANSNFDTRAFASTLKQFANFCDDKEICYLTSKSKVGSPLFKFKRSLQDNIEDAKLAPSTAKEKMRRLYKFYKHLVEEEKVDFDFCPWGKETKAKRLLKFNNGNSTVKEYTVIESSSIKGAVREEAETVILNGEVFDNGERLRPLSIDEQTILFKSLREIGNPEMLLAHQIIISTGARTQSIFTLRHCHFQQNIHENQKEVIVVAGRTGKEQSLCDSKKGSRFVIKFPVEIYKRVQLYINSERAQLRYDKARFKPHIESHQYVFMSCHGIPFYVSKSDPFRFMYSTIPEGQALTNFISKTLKPKLLSNGFKSPKTRYKFHNCRASFGLSRLNLHLKLELGNSNEYKTESEILQNNLGIKYQRALNKTQRDMNHRSITMTLLYVKLQEQLGLIDEVNSEWNKYLSDISGVSIE